MSAAEDALARLQGAIVGGYRAPGVTLMDAALDADVRLVRDALTKAGPSAYLHLVDEVPTEAGLYADKDGDQWRRDERGEWLGLSGASAGMTNRPPRRWGPWLRLNERTAALSEQAAIDPVAQLIVSALHDDASGTPVDPSDYAQRICAAVALESVATDSVPNEPEPDEPTPTDHVVHAFHGVEEALRSLPAEQTGEATLLLPLPDGRTLFRHVLLHPQSWRDSRGMR